MPAHDTDRNLLFGILALQNDFIDRDALLAAFATWVKGKERPLGEILCQAGKLTKLQDDLLRALAEQHIKQHGNDPKRSLSAVSTVGSIPDELRKLGDPHLEATLSLVAQQRSSNDVQTVAAHESSGTGQRFRVLRPYAKGGLGEVFVAQDEELNREVALKEIQARFANQTESRSRFRQEAEITGNLEHPGIVPVYGLGQYSDGRPFYAMRFIRGDSLKEAIERFHAQLGPAVSQRLAVGERSLELRKLLGRFVDVCNAIEYAHSRGVLHRDLKPGNVVLGKFGETLVVDWGLAKALGKTEHADASLPPVIPSTESGSTPTMLGSAIGTPAFMSPEQAAGRVNELGPATDVYSLGATLYCLLTGQPPFSGNDKGEILARVQNGDFPRPREVRPHVPAALQAICLKAMAQKPPERYDSPQMLADDIEHWLADEPVACYPEPPLVRARRWIKRHPALVVGTAATVLISLASLAAIASIIAQSNHALAAKNSELDAKNTALEQANLRERQATAKAEANAKVAREQSQLALRSLESVIWDIQRKLRNVLGAGDLQRSLLQTALARLQEVSDHFATRAAIDRSSHVALIDLGDVLLRIGAASPRSGTHGNQPSGEVGKGPAVGTDGSLAAARKVYQQAFEIAQKLVAADPSDKEAQRDMSISYNSLGDVSLQAGQITEALGFYQQAFGIKRKLAAADLKDNQAQRELSTSIERIGFVYERSGKLTEAREQYERMLAIKQRLAESNSADSLAQRELSVTYNHLGDVQLQSGKASEALAYYQKGLEIDQKLAAADPNDARAQRDLFITYNKLGDVQRQFWPAFAALGSYQKGLEISQKLTAADPNDVQAQRYLAISYDNLGDMQRQFWQATEALASFKKGLVIRQRLAAADPTDAQAQRDLSISLDNLGDMQLAAGQTPEALASYKQGLEIRQKLAAADLNDAQAQRDLSISFDNLGDGQLKAGRVTEALESFQRCLEIRKKLATADPSDAQARFALYSSLAKTGEANQTAKRFEEALSWYEQALKILQDLDEAKLLAPAEKSQIAVMQQRVQICQQARVARGEWKTLLEQPANVLTVLLDLRGTQFIHEGRTNDALQAVAKLRELGTATADQLYNSACVYSLCAGRIKPEKDVLTAEQAAERKKHIDDALETLREAIKAGYKDFAQMQKDTALTVLRDLPEFQELTQSK